MKWIKRLLLLVVFAVVFGIVCALSGWWLSRGTPEWYRKTKSDPQQMARAAENAEKQVQRTLSWAQEQQAYAARAQAAIPSTQPLKTLEISFSQDELNGFFQKWDTAFGWSERLGSYLSDPQIVLHDGHLILAAVVKETGTVLSIEFNTVLRDGKLDVSIARVLAGRLPLPESIWGRYRRNLESAVDANLPAWQAGAKIGRDGAANLDAVAAAMSELLLDALNERPAPAVLFLPYSVQGNTRSMPVNVTRLQIAHQTLTLDVEPVAPQQGAALLDTLRTANPNPQPAVAMNPTVPQ